MTGKRSDWERSHNYRDKFLKNTSPPYRCRYCNRWLKREYMVIDHIVPVAAARHSLPARWILRAQGAETVNDLKNLCACCQRCNSAKGRHMGIWLVRGLLGRYRGYWIGLRVVAWLLALLGVIIILPPLYRLCIAIFF